MAMHPVEDQYIGRFNGPFGISRWCKVCQFGQVARKPPVGQRGRGWGMREGNILRGKLIQHVKERHPDLYEAAMTERRARCEEVK